MDHERKDRAFAPTLPRRLSR